MCRGVSNEIKTTYNKNYEYYDQSSKAYTLGNF